MPVFIANDIFKFKFKVEIKFYYVPFKSIN